jgi:TonB family protein
MVIVALLFAPESAEAQCCVVLPNVPGASLVDEAPLPTNGEEVVELLRRVAEAAPREWADRSIEAWVEIDAEGGVVEAQVARSSGNPDLDAVLLAVAGRMKFTPGKSEGVPVEVLLRFPVSLRTN